MKKIYISGPISGLPLETVYNNFTNAEVNLLEKGYKVVNPFNNGLPTTATWEEHMRADLKLLLDCDAIYMLEGWEKSRGARIEYALAVDLKMDVQYQHKYSHALNLDLSIAKAGYFFSINPAMIKSISGRKIISKLPKHLVLTETDGPFINENDYPIKPGQVNTVISYLSEEWLITEKDVKEIIRLNFYNLLNYIK